MLQRVSYVLAFATLLATSATAQVVRFETSIGSFDMVLNPTNNPRLQGHVDNMLAYVEDERYKSSWINRADTGFVLQMGGFYSHTKRPPLTIESTRPVVPFAPVLGAPQISGLSNTIGTVALALPGDGQGGTNENAGTSSFFVNLASNSFLDPDFTVFAAIPDMTVVNEIMALTTIDRTTDDMFGADPGNLGFTDVPIQANGQQVFIKRAFVIDDAMSVARALAGVGATMATSAESFSGSGSSTVAPVVSAPVSSAIVPEPNSLALATLAVALVATRRRRSS